LIILIRAHLEELGIIAGIGRADMDDHLHVLSNRQSRLHPRDGGV
jgi:hypothetical protein